MITMCKDMKKFGVWCLKFEVFLTVHKKTGRILFPPVYFLFVSNYAYSVTSA